MDKMKLVRRWHRTARITKMGGLIAVRFKKKKPIFYENNYLDY